MNTTIRYRSPEQREKVEAVRKTEQELIAKGVTEINKSGTPVYKFIKPLKVYLGGGIRLHEINEGPFKKGDTMVSYPNFEIDWKNDVIRYKVISQKAFAEGKGLQQETRTLKASEYLKPTKRPYEAIDYASRIAGKKESAGLVVIYKDSILLVHPTGSADVETYSIPKGKMEVGEQPEQAALREFQEETGLIPKVKLNPHTPYFTINTPVRNLHFFVLEIDSYADLGMNSAVVDKSKLQLKEVDWAGFVPFKEAYNKMSPYQLTILQLAENFKKLKPSTLVVNWTADNGKYDFTIKERGQGVAFADGQQMTKEEMAKRLSENGVPPKFHEQIFNSTDTKGELPVVYHVSKNYSPSAAAPAKSYGVNASLQGNSKYIIAAWIAVPVFTGIVLYAINQSTHAAGK